MTAPNHLRFLSCQSLARAAAPLDLSDHSFDVFAHVGWHEGCGFLFNLFSAFAEILYPERMELVALPVRRRNQPHLLSPTAQWIRDRGQDCTPGLVGILEESKFGRQNIGGVTADGIGLARHSNDARSV